MARRKLLPAIAAFLATAWAGSAWAVDKSFIGAAGGDWSVAGNWSPPGVPTSNDRVIIAATRSAVVVNATPLVTKTVNANQLVVNGTLRLQDNVILVLGCTAEPFITGVGTVQTPPNVGTGFGTGRIEIRNATTGMMIQQSITLGNLTLNYTNSNPNTVSNAKMRIENGVTVRINGHLNIQVGNFQLGHNPQGATIVDVRGNVTIAGISFIDFKANDAVIRCGGNWTQLGTKFKDGANTTHIFDGTGNQVIAMTNSDITNVDFDNLVIAATTPTPAARTVTFLTNPLLGSGFRVNQNLTVGRSCTFIVEEGADATPEAGIAPGAAWTFRIESGATATFRANYNCSGNLVFRDTSNAGPLSSGTLRMEGPITNDASQLGATFTPGVGTVEYAGAGQTVYTRIGGVTPISYYNLTVDTTGGGVATQEAAPLAVANTLRIGKTTVTTNTAAIFTAVAQTITVGNDIICNGTFNRATSTVIMNTALDGTGRIASDVASPPALTFNILTINGNATSLAMDVVTAARNFAVANTFTIPRAKLTLSPGVTVDAQIGVTVGDNVLPAGVASDSMLELLANVTFRIGTGFTLLAQPDSTFFTGLRSSPTGPTVTRIGGAGTFATSILGVVDITKLNFSFGNVNGLNITTAAANVRNLRNITFGAQDASLAGTNPADLTILSTGLDFDCPSCVFGTLVAGGVNVRAKGAGTGMRLRFEDRGGSPPGGGGGGAGAGELRDDDNDLNDNGVIDGADVGGGSIVQWVYTINLDMTGVIQGFPMPAFDFNNFGAYYSTYVIMRQGVGVDTVYVLDANGDLAYSLPPLGAGAGNIVGPLFWDTEGTTHVLYFGTTTGRVYKFIDTGAALVLPAGDWSTPFVSGSLTTVTSWIVSDLSNLYFGGANGATNGIYTISIATKSLPPSWPISTTTRAVTTAPSWSPTTLGPSLFLGSNAVGSVSNIYRVKTAVPTIDATFTTSSPVTIPPVTPTPGLPTDNYCTTSIVAPTNLAFNGVLYVGESNGWMHGLPGLGLPGEFVVPASGFPFRDSTSAITGGATWEIFRGRLFFGNAAGNLYILGTYVSGWTLGSNYHRVATGASPITSFPLYDEGLVYVGNGIGRLFVVDADTGAGAPALLRTYNLGTTLLSDTSRDYTTNRLYTGTAGGRLYSIAQMIDPTVPR